MPRVAYVDFRRHPLRVSFRKFKDSSMPRVASWHIAWLGHKIVDESRGHPLMASHRNFWTIIFEGNSRRWFQKPVSSWIFEKRLGKGILRKLTNYWNTKLHTHALSISLSESWDTLYLFLGLPPFLFFCINAQNHSTCWNKAVKLASNFSKEAKSPFDTRCCTWKGRFVVWPKRHE